MSYHYFEVNGKRNDCDKKGNPVATVRKELRHYPSNEVETEKEYLKKVSESNLDVKKSECYFWLTTKFGHVHYWDVIPLGKIISLHFNIPYPREIYRRLSTTLYWFNENWEQIKGILNTNTIIGYHKTKGKIVFNVTVTTAIMPVIIILPKT